MKLKHTCLTLLTLMLIVSSTCLIIPTAHAQPPDEPPTEPPTESLISPMAPLTQWMLVTIGVVAAAVVITLIVFRRRLKPTKRTELEESTSSVNKKTS